MEDSKEEVIRIANNYYNGRDTGVTDKYYDVLLKKVQDEDPSFNIFNHIKYDVDFISGYHDQVFRSASKSHITEITEVIEYLNTEGIGILTPKYDGSSIRAYYKEGELDKILTRGDEYTGIVQTEKLKNKVPLLVDKSIIAIDFEACVSIEDYDGSVRGKANGLVNSKYMQEEVDSLLYLIPFDVLTTNINEPYLDRIKKFERLYFNLVSRDKLSDPSYIININDSKYIKYGEKTFPIDGFVLYKENNVVEILKYYYSESAIAKVVDVEWNEAKSTYYVPKLIIDTTYIDNRGVSRVASGGAVQLMERKMGIGSEIRIINSGSTIPYPLEVITSSEDYNMPKCTHCNRDLEFNGPNPLCLNPDCKGIFTNIHGCILYSFMEEHLVLEFIEKYPIDLDSLENIFKEEKYYEHGIKSGFNINDLSQVIWWMYISRLSTTKVDKLKEWLNTQMPLIDAINNGFDKTFELLNWNLSDIQWYEMNSRLKIWMDLYKKVYNCINKYDLKLK